jgi:hypothetical protein
LQEIVLPRGARTGRAPETGGDARAVMKLRRSK